jgi:hypothetical protein
MRREIQKGFEWEDGGRLHIKMTHMMVRRHSTVKEKGAKTTAVKQSLLH